MQSIENKVISRIYGHGRGWVFTPRDFLDLAGRSAVDVSLARLNSAGIIRSLGRGLYDYPRKHPVLGVLLPQVESIARALAGNSKLRLIPSGAYAANVLGLTEQVPLKIVFLTDGPSKTVRIKNQEIILKRTTPKNLGASKVGGLVIQALRYIGKDNIEDELIRKLSLRFNEKEKQLIQKDIPLAPAWVGRIMRRISEHYE